MTTNFVNIIHPIIICGLAALCIAALTSQSWPKRIKWATIYAVCLFSYMFLFLSAISYTTAKLQPDSLMSITIFGFSWPYLVSILINQQRAIPSLAFINQKPSISWMLFIAIVIFLGFTIFYVGNPNTWAIDTNEPIYDEDFFRSRLTTLLSVLPYLIIFFILAIQKTVFHENGILTNGANMAWSDFQSYEWENLSNNPQHFELLLHTKNIWFVKEIKFQASAKEKEQIESILVQKIQS